MVIKKTVFVSILLVVLQYQVTAAPFENGTVGSSSLVGIEDKPTFAEVSKTEQELSSAVVSSTIVSQTAEPAEKNVSDFFVLSEESSATTLVNSTSALNDTFCESTETDKPVEGNSTIEKNDYDDEAIMVDYSFMVRVVVSDDRSAKVDVTNASSTIGESTELDKAVTSDESTVSKLDNFTLVVNTSVGPIMASSTLLPSSEEPKQAAILSSVAGQSMGPLAKSMATSILMASQSPSSVSGETSPVMTAAVTAEA